MEVCILGTGNVAYHLEKWLSESGVKACIRSARDAKESWPDADIYLLAVTDDAIKTIARKLETRNAIIAHLSGSTPLSAINNCNQSGVIYPVQTFTKGISMKYAEIPVLVEGATAETTEILWALAGRMTSNRKIVDSERRLRIHIASVFASNFTNHILLLAEEQLHKSNFDLELLRPLLEATLAKALAIGPLKAQTGPARRKDKITMEAHTEMLSDLPNSQAIYQLFSSSINDTYNQ